MTEPAKPKNDDLVEMEAMDLEEWERDKHTPSAGDRLNELVKQTATPPPLPPSRKTQTIARTVARPASEPNPFDGPTVRNAGAGIAPTGGDRMTQAIGTRGTTSATPAAGTPRTQTPPAGTPAGSAPTSATQPSAAPPPPRPATAAQAPVRPSTPAVGTPLARITPTSIPAQQTQPVTRNTTSRTPALGVSAKPAASQPAQRPSQPSVSTATPTRTQTPAVGVGVSSGRAATQPGATKTQAMPAASMRPATQPGAARAMTQAMPATTRPAAAPARPPTPLPIATVPVAEAKDDALDTEGWALPDDDMAVPSEPRKILAPKPKLDAMAAENWSLPDSIVEEPPLPPSKPPVAEKPAFDASPFGAETTVGSNALDEDLPIAIAPQAAASVAFVESVEPVSSPQIETDLEMSPSVPEPIAEPVAPPPRAFTPPPMQAVVAPQPDPFAPPPPRAFTPPPPRAFTPPPVASEGGPPDVFEADDTMSPEQQRAIKTAMFAVPRTSSKNTKIAVGVLAAVVVAVLVFLAIGRGDKPTQVADTEIKKPVKEPDPAPPPVDQPVVDPNAGSGSAAVEPPPLDPTPVDPTPVDRTPPPVDPTPTTNPTRTPPATTPTRTPTPAPTGRTPTGRRPKGNKVTTTPTTPTETAAPVNDGAETAKSEYNAGNKALYAGDAAGAVAHFQAALSSMPRYAAAQRGLGLAYSSLGNKAKAVTAFKAYLAASPGAKDTDKIQERITALSR